MKKIIRSNLLLTLFAIVLMGSWCYAFADRVENTPDQSTATENTAVKNTVVGTAKDWGLTDQEWARYLNLMQGADGLWYRQLTPTAVLGLHAMNQDEQSRFAHLVAEQEHDRVARELAFNAAVLTAMRQLYPNEPMIRPFDKTPFNPLPETASSEVVIENSH